MKVDVKKLVCVLFESGLRDSFEFVLGDYEVDSKSFDE
jgi:hypothetical protein